MDLYSNGLMVSRALLTENPDAVAGLVRAVNKATMEVAGNQDSSVTEIGMGDLVDERLTRSIEIVAKGYGLDRLPEASEIFDRSFLPPIEARAFEVTLN